jgi:hypothetical protein
MVVTASGGLRASFQLDPDRLVARGKRQEEEGIRDSGLDLLAQPRRLLAKANDDPTALFHGSHNSEAVAAAGTWADRGENVATAGSGGNDLVRAPRDP